MAMTVSPGNLAALESRLQSDPAFRSQFLSSPVPTLRSLGFTLSVTQEDLLLRSAIKLRATSGVLNDARLQLDCKIQIETQPAQGSKRIT
jgi:hypothetical protein